MRRIPTPVSETLKVRRYDYLSKLTSTLISPRVVNLSALDSRLMRTYLRRRSSEVNSFGIRPFYEIMKAIFLESI